MIKYNFQKLKSNITNVNGINSVEKSSERQNLKPINGGRKGDGGGLLAFGYEPNKNSIFNYMNFEWISLSKNRLENNNERKKMIIYLYSILENLNNNNFGRNETFGMFEINNLIMNKFNNEMIGGFRRRKYFHSSLNILGWNF